MPETPLGYDNPGSRFLDYVNLNVGKGLVIGLTISVQDQPPTRIQFSSTATPQQQTTINNIAFSTPQVFGGWAGLPIPNYAGFRHDVITDPSAPQYPLAVLLAYLVSDSSLSYSDRKTFASVASGWITASYPAQATAIINTIKAYGVSRNLPLE